VRLTLEMGVRVPSKERCPMYKSTGRNVVVSASVTSISTHSLSDVTAVNKRNSTNGNLRHVNKTVTVLLLKELRSFGQFI
jgi:Ca2+-dependent lipid-binding protein